jgi:predicted dehydrogenase
VLAHARDLIAEGAIGQVRSAGLVHSCDWISKPTPSMAYLQDRASGAHFLSIPGGHSIDALCWLLGEYESLSATLKTVMAEVEIVGTGEHIQRSSADEILVSGALVGGALASVRLSGAPSPGTGIRLEINGDKGDLVVSAAPGGRGIQMSDLTLHKTIGMAKLEQMEVPERYFAVPESARKGPPLNVGQAYVRLADAIENGGRASPDFHDAVARHQTLDRVEQAARTGDRI